MPEGDTIFRTARALDRALRGTLVTRFSSVFPRLNRLDEDAPIAGRSVERVEARGKHLLIWFTGELALRTHMRMSGSWHLYRPGEAWQRPRDQLRILLETARFVAVAFQVHDAEWLDPGRIERSALARLGPDVLGAEFDLERTAERIVAERGRPICDVILDQRVLAGLGNVYKSELLFLTKLHPLRAAESVPRQAARELVRRARVLLKQNVDPAADGGGAIVTYRGLRRSTRRADPGERSYVYARTGQACRSCATPIVSALLGTPPRRTYFCPTCQPAAAPAP